MATVPPGLLNMNAAKTSVQKGKSIALIFSLGVVTIIMCQAYIGVMISKLLHQNPEVIRMLLRIAVVVFATLAVVFFLAARRKDTNTIEEIKVSRRNSFLRGMLLATVNLLTIPYYSGLNAMWKEAGWIKFQLNDILVFVLAAGLGSFTVLYLYTVYFTKLEQKRTVFSQNANYILSALMVVLLGITLVRIFKS